MEYLCCSPQLAPFLLAGSKSQLASFQQECMRAAETKNRARGIRGAHFLWCIRWKGSASVFTNFQ